VPQPSLNPYDFAWLTNRDILINAGDSSGTSLYRIPATGSAPARVLAGLGPGVRQIDLSPESGRLVYGYNSQDTNVWRVDLVAAAPVPAKFVTSTFREVFPQYSPDGRRISFHSNRAGSVQIWVSNADGSEPAQLTSMSGTTTGSARWSPDGQRICFDSNTGGNWQIYTIAADGGKPQPVTSDSNNNITPSWSRDGRWIYFGSRKTGRFEIWKISSQGGEAAQVTRNGGIAGVESPDGKTLYFTRETGDGIWRTPAEGGPETQVVKEVFRNNYVVTTEGIYYTPPPAADRTSAIQYLDFASGSERTIAKLEKRPDLGLTLSPDRRYLLFTLIDFEGSDLLLAEGFR
jgi:Tol biopolymer transport system component